MNKRLSEILASDFWRNADPIFNVEEASIGISGQDGDYRWYLIDNRQATYSKCRQSFSTIQAAKDDLQQFIEKRWARQ